MPGAIDECGQQIEGPWTQRDRRARLEQTSLVDFELEWSEAIALGRSGRGHCRVESAKQEVYTAKATTLPSRDAVEARQSDRRIYANDRNRARCATAAPGRQCRQVISESALAIALATRSRRWSEPEADITR